jgi:hypothetical protein
MTACPPTMISFSGFISYNLHFNTNCIGALGKTKATDEAKRPELKESSRSFRLAVT